MIWLDHKAYRITDIDDNLVILTPVVFKYAGEPSLVMSWVHFDKLREEGKLIVDQ